MKFIKATAIIFLLLIVLVTSACDKKITIQVQRPKKIVTQITKVPKGHRFKRIVVKSKFLNKAMKVNIYLPKGYNKKNRYPVLYILSGSSGDQNFCIPGLNMDEVADKLIVAKKINPLIIITTEMDNSFGLNSSKKHVEIKISRTVVQLGRYEDYLSKELVSYVDSHYSTINNRKGRYIGGMSDGGYIALRTAFLHSYEYSKVGGHSPNISHEHPNKVIENLYFNSKRIDPSKDLFFLAQNSPISTLDVYLDCGNIDTHKFYVDSGKLYNILHARGIKTQYHLNNGSHSTAYWKSKIGEYLMFYAGKPKVK